MNNQSRGFRALMLMVLVLGLAVGADGLASGQEKEKDSIKALFEGIPADLRSKVRDNPVRCDRVNDWLKNHVNGKGKTIDIRLRVNNVVTSRSEDGTYIVRLSLAPAKGKFLEDDWRVYFTNQVADGPTVPASAYRDRNNFAFTGVSTTEAEKLVDLKQIVIQGKVHQATLARSVEPGPFGMKGLVEDGVVRATIEGTISVALEDVRVDGKQWATYTIPAKATKGKGGFSPDEFKSKGKKSS